MRSLRTSGALRPNHCPGAQGPRQRVQLTPTGPESMEHSGLLLQVNLPDNGPQRTLFIRIAVEFIDVQTRRPRVAGYSIRIRNPDTVARAVHDTALAVTEDAPDGTVQLHLIDLVRL